jgi:ferredoxin
MALTIFFAFIGPVLFASLVLWLLGEHWRLLLKSTRSFMRELGVRRALSLDGLHAYVYGRWINQYVDILRHLFFPRIGPKRKERWANHYHGKVITHDQAKAIITVDKGIPLRDLEQIIPYSTARNLVLKGPPDVAVVECACRHSSDVPCQPAQVCMAIGQPFVDFILEHRPDSSRKLTQTEALELLRSEHERGHLHSAWFKDVLLNRFYGICNCCKCCCAGIEAMAKYGIPMIASSGFVAQIDRERCTLCGICVDTCAFGALSCNDVAEVSWEKCMGCGVCVGQCSVEAVALVRDERKGTPLDVRLLADDSVFA